MKTNKPHILLLLTLTAVFTCCSGDDYSDINTSGSSTAPFTITVTDGGYASLSGSPSTRASEANYKTIFTEGDQIGVFAVKGDKIVDEVNNLHLCYTDIDDETGLINLVWTDVTSKIPLNLNGGATYYAYYPYKDNLDTNQLDPTAATAAGFFAKVISNWSPATEQNTYADYTAQDLMIAKGNANFTNKSLSFTMQHQMALAVIDLPRIEYAFTNILPQSIPNYVINVPNANFANFAPCRMKDGTYRYLMNPSTTKDVLFSGSYTSADGPTTWKAQTNTIATGKYQIIEVDGGCRKLEHELAVGDFFMKDGTLLAGSTQSLTPDQQAACIGIVFSIDPDRIGNIAKQVLTEKGSAPHGLVMALTDASEGCRWSKKNTKDENKTGKSGEPFYENTDQLDKMYNNVDGYAETQWIIDKYGNNIQDTYPAFYHASIYGTVESGTSQYATPTNTTGWFIPSMGQWWDILSNLGGIKLSTYQDRSDSDIAISGAAAIAVDNMNKYLGKISDGPKFNIGTYFWSSSECSSYLACSVNLCDDYLYLDYLLKSSDAQVLRCVFAF